MDITFTIGDELFEEPFKKAVSREINNLESKHG